MRTICISVIREHDSDVNLRIEVDGRNPYGSPQYIRPHQVQTWIEGFIAALPPLEEP